MSKKHQI
jgi:hypothetical protein